MTVLEQEYYETMIRSMVRISEALEKILKHMDEHDKAVSEAALSGVLDELFRG